MWWMESSSHIRMSAELDDAWSRAARRRQQSKSEYARQALLVAVERDGIDLSAGDVKARAA